MAKILIIYDSKTGNTKKMAMAIAQGVREVKGTEVVVKKVDQVVLQDLVKADGLIIGSPTYYGQMSAKIKALVDKSVKIHGQLEGKVGAAFTSSGGTATGAETTLLSILQAMLVHGMIIFGRANDKHYGAAAVEEPNKNELASCYDLGQRLANLVLKLKT
ncbi:MAG: NAD(P)H-dependent oxidoreductase [Candidatus Aminicenantes bacterium]|nr:NAD(P)H-dependent oxidoreductase [Candidatus Aminicenantes bacterium]